MPAFDVNGPANITTQNIANGGVGTATPGSAVEADITGASQAVVRVSGTYTGALSIQVTQDAAPATAGSAQPVWETVAALWVTPAASGTAAAGIASAAVGHNLVQNLGPFRRMRVVALAAVTGTAVVTISSIPYIF